jgi:transcriptional regulator with XRE-family HTH domain
MRLAVMRKSIHRAEYEVLVGLLRERREVAGITQTELSRALGRSQSFVSDLERGQRRLDLIELRDICAYLRMDLGKFVGEFEARLRSSAVSRKRRR